MNNEIAKMLEFQKVEGEIIKIDREIESNPNNVTKNKMINVVKESQKVAESLEAEAKGSIQDFEKVKAQYDENLKKAEKFNAINIQKLSDEQLIKLNDELENVLGNLNIIEKKLVVLNKGVETILERFEKAKQNAFIAKTNFQNAKTALDKVIENFKASREKFENALKKMAPQINKDLFSKYSSLRKEKIFPVLAELTKDNRCGACRMEQSLQNIERIKNSGYSFCENCHRIIYN